MSRLGWIVLTGLFVSVGCRPSPNPSVRVEPASPTVPLREQARRLGLRYPLRQVFLRAFKSEKRLELWASNGTGPMVRVRGYSIAAASGDLGPKRHAGDLQVPEGVYRIDRFNPHSRFHLSLGLNYPNSSDRRRSNPKYPGTDIFIHGNRVSIGCLAMTDRVIDELYPVCQAATNRRSISVHIFPSRLDDSTVTALERRYPHQASFWAELKPIYDAFETSHRIPRVTVLSSGAYRLKV
jgi:murein L,D-transpeptidase YafK